jgi:hypothetical protein
MIQSRRDTVADTLEGFSGNIAGVALATDFYDLAMAAAENYQEIDLI